MSMMWIKKQAPWVLGFFGVFILGGLVMMDRAGSYKADRHHNIVGKVDGEDIPTDRFQQEMKNYLQSEESRSGKAPEGIQLVQMREGLFNYKVQAVLLQKTFKDYQLYASVEEMQEYLLKHPQEVGFYIQRYQAQGVEHLPPFLADSVVDTGRFQAWLSQDSVYDRPSMRDMEAQLRQTVIPQAQLQQLLKSQVHRTTLEEAYAVTVKETRARLKYYQVPVDSFPLAADKFKEPELKAYFEANPDSFYFHDEAARLGFLRIPLNPSKADSNLMLDFAKELKERAQNGEKFADLAKDYSNDPLTAEKGGKMEGFQGRNGMDPILAAAAFALKPGEISQPILSPSGYQLVQLNDKKTENGEEKVEISHIFLKVTAGTETVDSLMELAGRIRSDAQKQGLDKAAKANALGYDSTGIFEKSNMTPLGSAYVQGVNSFAFSDFDSKEKVSEPLQAEDGIYLLERKMRYPKGRSFERAKPRIAEILAKNARLESAKKELESQRDAIVKADDASLPARIGKAVLDSTRSGPISADNWLPGFGYASPALFAAFGQQQGVWGPVLTSDMGAVMAKVAEKIAPTPQEAMAKGEAVRMQPDTYQANAVFQDWLNNLQKSVKVENKLDFVYRN